MPIYEFYCPENHRIYQFYARTLAQGRSLPKCPDNPAFTMRKILSSFAVVGGAAKAEAAQGPGPSGGPSDGRMEAAMGQLEKEFTSVDENDPRAMGRMMRRMAELTGERIDGAMEEVVRKLEEGADPDSIEEELAPETGVEAGGPEMQGEAEGRAPKRVRRAAPIRDPKLYEFT